MELIEFLLNSNSKAQAQAELIALAENLGEDPSQQERVGDLFLQVQDYEHALAAYRLRLKEERGGAGLGGGRVCGASNWAVIRWPSITCKPRWPRTRATCRVQSDSRWQNWF